MPSATSSTSSRPSTAWPTSGRGGGRGPGFVCRFGPIHTDAPRCSPQQIPVGGVPESGRVLRPGNPTGLLRLRQTRRLGRPRRPQQVRERVVVRRSRYLYVFCCFCPAGPRLRSSLRSGTPSWATSPSPLRLTRCSRSLGEPPERRPLHNRLTFLIKAAILNFFFF